MSDGSSRYRAYLLRLWQTSGGGPATWRASLEDPRTHERRGFPDLERLFAFLARQTERESGDRPDGGEGWPSRDH